MRGNRNFLTKMERLINLCLRKKIKVQAGVSPCTNGKDTIYLPPLPEKASAEDILLHENFAFHEKSHFMGKSDPKTYLKGQLQHSICNAFDDIRCERIQERSYSGIKIERRDFYRMMIERHPRRFMVKMEPSIHQFIYELTCYMIMKWRSEDLKTDVKLETSEELYEAYQMYVEDLHEETMKQKTQDDTVRLAQKLYDRIKDLIRDKLEEEKEKEDGKDESKPEDSDPLESTESKESGEGGYEKDTNTDSRDTGSDSEDPEDGEDNDESSSSDSSGSDGEEESSDKKIRKSTEGGGATDVKGDTPDSPKELTPEEREELEEKLKKIMEGFDDIKPDIDIYEAVKEEIEKRSIDIDRVYMVDPAVKDIIRIVPEGNDAVAKDLRDQGLEKLGVSGAQMAKLFISQSHPRILRNQNEGRFNMRSFMADPMDKRKDIYTRKIRGQLEKAAVSILIDLSGSMKGKTIKQCYALLQAMLYYLHRAAVPTMAAGYTTEGLACSSIYRDVPVRIDILKQFHESFSGTVMRRCVPPDNMQQNCEYDACKWAVPQLLARPEKKKILFIIGDGSPIIGSYILNNKLSKAYAEYLELCRQAGITVFGFGIGADLRRFFKEHFVSVTSSNLGEEFVQKMKQALTSK